MRSLDLQLAFFILLFLLLATALLAVLVSRRWDHRQQQRRLLRLLEPLLASAPIAFVALDESGMLLAINPFARRLFGLTANAQLPLGTRWADYYFALAGFVILTGLKNHKSCPTAV